MIGKLLPTIYALLHRASAKKHTDLYHVNYLIFRTYYKKNNVTAEIRTRFIASRVRRLDHSATLAYLPLILNNITVKIDVTKKNVTGEIWTTDCTGTMFIELILWMSPTTVTNILNMECFNERMEIRIYYKQTKNHKIRARWFLTVRFRRIYRSRNRFILCWY